MEDLAAETKQSCTVLSFYALHSKTLENVNVGWRRLSCAGKMAKATHTAWQSDKIATIWLIHCLLVDSFSTHCYRLYKRKHRDNVYVCNQSEQLSSLFAIQQAFDKAKDLSGNFNVYEWINFWLQT